MPEQIVFNKNRMEKEIHKIYAEYRGNYSTVQNIFEESRDELISNPESEKSLEQFAEGIFVSKFYYIRKIKAVSGLTPHKLIVQSRIRKSQKILQSGTNIVDTTLITGFYDQSHFNKYFKKIVGYRRLNTYSH